MRSHASAWVATPPRARIELIDRLTHDTLAVADRWTSKCAAAEGLDLTDPASAEEAIVGPFAVLRYLRFLRRSLEQIERDGVPRVPGGVRTLPNGQAAARVFPADTWDRLFYTGVTAEVWMEPGVDAASVRGTQAEAYRDGKGPGPAGAAGGRSAGRDGSNGVDGAGRVCLVLGAGNVSSIGALDALTKLFVDNVVVVLKMHPVQDHLGPILQDAMAALVQAGCLRIVSGGAGAGTYLGAHPGVDELHITGSDRTYEAIVFGGGDDGRARKARDEAIFEKPISAELGNVTPVIIVPGAWSAADLAYHADNVTTMLANNAGFNCGAARVIVTHAAWPQREAFLDAVRRRLAAIPPKVAYYPGARSRYESFVAAHPEGETFGGRVDGRLPWLLVADLDPSRHDDPCFRTEAFCGVFAETSIAAPSAAEFVDRAVEFANDRLWGSLNANLIVSGRSMRDRAVGRAVERAIADLRYGTVSVNHWASLSFALAVTPWGAFAGHVRSDIQSGTGTVHNAMMFSRPQKTVIRAPFRARPKPVWFASHTSAHRLARELVRFEASPSPLRVPRIFFLALRG